MVLGGVHRMISLLGEASSSSGVDEPRVVAVERDRDATQATVPMAKDLEGGR